jgi:F0F1-type ATP synthase membrane subunit c/vacuolar-type H+-ATPase subunit K
MPNDDPGWPWPLFLLFLIPGAQQRYIRRRSSDPIVALRASFLAFSGAFVVFGVVLAVMGGLPNGPVVPWLPILIAIAAASVVVQRVAHKPLDCSSDTALAGSYRSRFFVNIAVNEAVVLFGFVFTLIGGPAWIYLVGAAFSLDRLWTVVAPTQAALARDQEALNARGCTLSLVQALRSAPPPT